MTAPLKNYLATKKNYSTLHTRSLSPISLPRLQALNAMEILRENFQRELPYIKEAIEECEFIAVDAEFSGTHTHPQDRLASFYESKTPFVPPQQHTP